MLRLIAAVAVLLVTPNVGAAQSLKGVWLGTGSRVIGGPNDGLMTEYTETRLLIYTDAFFMWTFGGTTQPRPLADADASDAEIVQAIQGYQGVGGTYQVVGREILYNRLVSLNPGGALPENQPLVREIRTLTQNRMETELTNAEGVTTVLIYTRVE